MSRQPLFECDSCGERFGHLNELFPIDARYSSGEYEAPEEERLHGCLTCMPASVTAALDTVEWIGFPSATGRADAERVKFEGAEESVPIPEVDVRAIEGEPFENSDLMDALEYVRRWLVAPGAGGEVPA